MNILWRGSREQRILITFKFQGQYSVYETSQDERNDVVHVRSYPKEREEKEVTASRLTNRHIITRDNKPPRITYNLLISVFLGVEEEWKNTSDCVLRSFSTQHKGRGTRNKLYMTSSNHQHNEQHLANELQQHGRACMSRRLIKCEEVILSKHFHTFLFISKPKFSLMGLAVFQKSHIHMSLSNRQKIQQFPLIFLHFFLLHQT